MPIAYVSVAAERVEEAGQLAGRLEPGLGAGRLGDDLASRRAGQVEVVILGARGPVVPLQRRADERTAPYRDRVPFVARGELVPAVGVRVDERAAPMLLRPVAGRVHPEDPGGSSRGDDPLRRVGQARAVTAAGVEPADGVADDLDPVGARVRDGQAEPGDVLDADEIELRVGRHLGHDLGDARAVARRIEASVPAEVDLDRRFRKVARALAAAIPAEPEVDDGDLDAGTARTDLVPEGRARRCDALSPHRFRHGSSRLSDEPDVSTARQRPERRRRDERLDHPAVALLDPSASPHDGCSGTCRTSGQQLYVDSVGGKAREPRVQLRDLDRMSHGMARLARAPERACAARRSARSSKQPAQPTQNDPPQSALPQKLT